MDKNTILNDGFNQVCIWEGTSLGDSTPECFVEFMQAEFQVRIQFLEEIETLPDVDRRGIIRKDTGGRKDLIFAVHNHDVAHFAVPRLKAGIRWIEDVYGNGNGHRYPERLAAYRTWQY